MPTTAERRERAARALCRKLGYSEETMFDGRPAWEWYLERAEAVLDAAFTQEEMEQLQGAEKDGHPPLGRDADPDAV